MYGVGRRPPEDLSCPSDGAVHTSCVRTHSGVTDLTSSLTQRSYSPGGVELIVSLTSVEDIYFYHLRRRVSDLTMFDQSATKATAFPTRWHY